eukprot:Hpha_TRINITY_DN18339_c0_g1::TRINITY_DN18339_c0_g1_i1::g.158285::m.158285
MIAFVFILGLAYGTIPTLSPNVTPSTPTSSPAVPGLLQPPPPPGNATGEGGGGGEGGEKGEVGRGGETVSNSTNSTPSVSPTFAPVLNSTNVSSSPTLSPTAEPTHLPPILSAIIPRSTEIRISVFRSQGQVVEVSATRGGAGALSPGLVGAAMGGLSVKGFMTVVLGSEDISHLVTFMQTPRPTARAMSVRVGPLEGDQKGVVNLQLLPSSYKGPNAMSLAMGYFTVTPEPTRAPESTDNALTMGEEVGALAGR